MRKHIKASGRSTETAQLQQSDGSGGREDHEQNHRGEKEKALFGNNR